MKPPSSLSLATPRGGRPLADRQSRIRGGKLGQAAAAVALVLAAGCLTVAHAQGVRQEVGKPLKEAGDLLRAGKAKEALAKAREADNIGGKTPGEQLVIDRMKAAAAQRAGDMGAAIQALESLHPRVSGGEAGQVAEQLASAYAQQRNNGKASEWLNKAIAAGNNSATVKQMQAYLQSASGDYNAIARDAGAAVSAAEQAVSGGAAGGTALLSHALKAGIRLGVNTSPEPASNIVLSLIEDGIVAVVVALVLKEPLVALALVIVLLAIGITLVLLMRKAIRGALERRRARRRGREPPPG